MTVGGKYKRWSERVWERRGGGGGVTMSHQQDLSSGGPGCCGGGSQCDTYAVTHTQRDAGRHAAYMSPPAVEAGGRQCRDATEKHSSHTLVHKKQPFLQTHTHMQIMMMAEDGWRIYSCRKEKRTEYAPHAFLHLSHTISFIIHNSLGTYAEADVVKREQSEWMTCKKKPSMMYSSM